MSPTLSVVQDQPVRIPVSTGTIDGVLATPESMRGVVLFAHGSGSSRYSPRNRFVASALNNAGLGTLLIDLLTHAEERIDAVTAGHRFDVQLLADRLRRATDWLTNEPTTRELPIGYFGASTGAAAALAAAAQLPAISAVVSRGGRPDLAGDALPKVTAATLLIVGGSDLPVIELNQMAHEQLTSARAKELTIVQGATHLFEEPGTLDEVARLASEWFLQHLQPGTRISQSDEPTHRQR